MIKIYIYIYLLRKKTIFNQIHDSDEFVRLLRDLHHYKILLLFKAELYELNLIIYIYIYVIKVEDVN